MNKDHKIIIILQKRTNSRTHPGLAEPAAAAAPPPAARCSRCAGRGEPPAEGDRVSGATCAPSAGSSHWPHRSSPAAGRHTALMSAVMRVNGLSPSLSNINRSKRVNTLITNIRAHSWDFTSSTSPQPAFAMRRRGLARGGGSGCT